jgi:hypothetical protein
MNAAHNLKNAEMRFEAVALSVTSSASEEASRLSARYVSAEILMLLEKGEQRSKILSSSRVPVTVDRGKLRPFSPF